MIVYPEERYDFKSEITYKKSAILIQCFHHIAVVRDVDDRPAVFEDKETPAEPMRIKQKDGAFIEIPRPNTSPTVERVMVKPGYQGVRVETGDDEELADIMRQVTWDYKIRRGMDSAEQFRFLIHFPKERRMIDVGFSWSGGAEVTGPLVRKESDYDKMLRLIYNVHDGAKVEDAPGFMQDTSLQDMEEAIKQFDYDKSNPNFKL